MAAQKEYRCGDIRKCDWKKTEDCLFVVSGEGWDDIWLTCTVCEKRVQIWGYDAKKNIRIYSRKQ